MTRRLLISAIVCTLAPAVYSPVVAHAQGALSTQGFGYPLGQHSTRSLGAGGALSEFDIRSPLNPAVITVNRYGQIFAQYDPELRTVKGPSGSSKTTTARFPNFGLTLPFGPRFAIGFNASTLLDRSWITSATREQDIGGEIITSTETVKSEGGITDLRFSIGYAITPTLRIGVGGHQYTGTNRVNLLQQFPDSLAYGNVSQTTRLNFSGTALSAGLIIDAIPTIGIALSGRKGGNIELAANDTNLTKGRVPDHYAASINYHGIPGTIVAARVAQDKWSSLASLSTNNAGVVDATEVNVGIESGAKLYGDMPIMLRAGSRWRTLPFLAGGKEVREVSFGGGIGIPIARDRASIDMAVLRSTRSGVTGVKENAYNFSFGLRVQP